MRILHTWPRYKKPIFKRVSHVPTVVYAPIVFLFEFSPYSHIPRIISIFTTTQFVQLQFGGDYLHAPILINPQRLKKHEEREDFYTFPT